jgi:hypothetical protein
MVLYGGSRIDMAEGKFGNVQYILAAFHKSMGK